jgi:hypothetical protein
MHGLYLQKYEPTKFFGELLRAENVIKPRASYSSVIQGVHAEHTPFYCDFAHELKDRRTKTRHIRISCMMTLL